MAELKKKFTTKALLEQIPAEKGWEITAQALTRLVVLRIHTARPVLGVGEGIISPIWGLEKYLEINTKIFGEGGKKLFRMAKEMFDIKVNDSIDAANLSIVAAQLLCGPEQKTEIVEATPEKTVVRWSKCAFFERYKEHEINLELTGCRYGCPKWAEEGLKATNPMITCKPRRQMPTGDPYCEYIYEFKEE
ncbi:hypothetical protein [Candidatus Borrarchaeum sp.]|uniref:hypothetical protein n=1 Tax=Candidatus Borrarchaeum sp. TaxID=2846742 RepID=UPI00257990D9|nr:hypothetical protein [Candidatus Borrarchaeum sp.]